MLNFLSRYFSQDITIDLGAVSTLIYITGQGIVLNEPSVATVEANSKKNGGWGRGQKKGWTDTRKPRLHSAYA